MTGLIEFEAVNRRIGEPDNQPPNWMRLVRGVDDSFSSPDEAFITDRQTGRRSGVGRKPPPCFSSDYGIHQPTSEGVSARPILSFQPRILFGSRR
jgi:hypothetical protein